MEIQVATQSLDIVKNPIDIVLQAYSLFALPLRLIGKYG